MADRTKIQLGRNRYTVVHDDQGVIRIEYTNGVRGSQNLHLDGRVAKAVLAAFKARI